jgi:predicted phage terminase large subunit-like protein
MAWIEGKFLNANERIERMKLLKERLRKLKLIYDAGKATDHHIDMLLSDKEELKKLNRVHRASEDVAYFAYEYLSDGANPDNEDNIIRNRDNGEAHQEMEDMAKLHRDFFDLCDYVDHVERNTNLAIAAPRGHNKSGTFSNILPLHQLVFRKRSYILVISETDTLSKKLIGWVNKQLKFNEKLRNDFGVLLHPKSTQNEKDNEESFITLTNALCEASSSGKQLRGKRHGSLRPDLVCIDDPSSMNNEGTKDARDKLISWFNSVVLPIGSESTAIVLVGTVVSQSGLLNHCMSRKDFKKSFHSAIVNEPAYPDLWQQYIELYSRADEMDEVNEFYEKNKPLLEQGVETAWSWRWTYRELMHKKANMGTKSFNSEYRNLAFSEDEQYFLPENFAYYRFNYDFGKKVIFYEGEEIPISRLYVTGAWDIAMGRTSRSCFNSCLIVGRDELTGLMFVLDEYASKEQPHIFMNKVVEKIRYWRPKQFGVETINAYHEFYRQLEERLRVEGIYQTRLKDVKSHKSSKEERIESLEPLVANKTLVFNSSHQTLLDQMAQYPFGDYVDSIDALQIATSIVMKPKAKLLEKPDWL